MKWHEPSRKFSLWVYTKKQNLDALHYSRTRRLKGGALHSKIFEIIIKCGRALCSLPRHCVFKKETLFSRNKRHAQDVRNFPDSGFNSGNSFEALFKTYKLPWSQVIRGVLSGIQIRKLSVLPFSVPSTDGRIKFQRNSVVGNTTSSVIALF